MKHLTALLFPSIYSGSLCSVPAVGSMELHARPIGNKTKEKTHIPTLGFVNNEDK